MATYYSDSAGSNTAPYDTWAKAATAIQTVLDLATAGEIIYARGTQTVAAQIDIDTNSGDETSGLIKIIGCNAGGTNDGTRFVLDAESNNIDIVAINQSYLWFENIEFKNSGNADGVDFSAGGAVVFLNCSSNNNGQIGFNCQTATAGIYFILCTAYGNGNDGFYIDYSSNIWFSSSHDNTDNGIDLPGGRYSQICGCLVYDNTGVGISGPYKQTTIFNCAINGNSEKGIGFASGAAKNIGAVIGNRITNHSGAGDIGLDCASEICIHGWNYFEDNDGNNIQNDTISEEILDDGSTTNQEDQADTNEGYTDLTDGSEDFNLRSDATLRRTAITIPLV